MLGPNGVWNPPAQPCWAGATLPNLVGIASFPADLAGLGLIPKNLRGALVELGVSRSRAPSLAAQIAIDVQAAIVEEYQARCKSYAELGGAKALFQQHVRRQ